MASSSSLHNAWMMDSAFLLKIWRRRDGQLLRLLNAHNLGQIKEEFDMVKKVTGKDGLGAADFVRVMLTLLSIVGSNQEELCIQIMELFANIDVNGDRTMEWEEFLNYVVETGYGVQSAQGDSGGEPQSSDASVFNRFSYRTITNSAPPSSVSDTDEAPSAAALSDAGNVFDVISVASVEFDEQTKTVFVLGFRYRGMLVYALRFGQEMQIPVLLPFKRFRHDFAFQSHQVVQAVFINDAGSATGILKEGSQIVVTCSQEWENGPTHINTFDFAEQVCLKRCKVQHASSVLFYAPSMAKVYSISREGSEVAYFDVHDACSSIDGRFPMGETMIVCAVPLPGHLSGAMFVGSAEGALSVWDLGKGKEIPGMSLIAHDYGVRAIQYCESHSQLVTIGQPHPRRIQGLPEHVYAVLLWDLGPWVSECRDGNALQRALTRQKAVARLQSAILEATTGAPGRGASAVSSAQAALAALPPPPPSSVTPTQLIGHRFPITKFSIQVESGTIPHVVSVDEGGQVRVWDMIKATCIQKLALYQAPRLAGLSNNSKTNEVLVKDGDEGSADVSDSESAQAGSKNAANGKLPAFSPFQKQAVVGLLNEFARKGSSAIDAAGNVGKMLRHGSATDTGGVSTSGGSGVAGARSLHLSTSSPNNPRHMSYGSAAVTLYPYRGEGAAEKEIRALGDAGMVDIAQTERGGSQAPTMSMLSMPSSIFQQASTGHHTHAPHIHNKLADGIVRAGKKYGVGRGGAGVGDGDDAVLYPTREEADEAVEGLLSRLVPTEELGGNLSFSAASLSTALRLVGIPDAGLLPEISPRRQRALNGGSIKSNSSVAGSPRSGKKMVVGGGVTGTLFAPSLSSDESLMESANTGAKIFKKDLQHQVEKNLREALGLTGISAIDAAQGIALSKSARKNLLNPVPLASSTSTIVDSDGSSPPSPTSAVQKSSSILGADSNVLSSLMELRLHGRRGSISDFALMLAHEAKQISDGPGKRKRKANLAEGNTADISDGSTREIKMEDSSAEAKMGGAVPEDVNLLASTGLGTSNKNTGYPSVILLLPKSIGGQEERNLMLVGGARAGITKATVRAGGGGLALKHGLRIFSFSQDLPDREPLIGAVFVPPSLHFVTGTSSALVVWDALSGRPVRMYSKNEVSDGRDLMCFTLDKRARKIIVGCVKGGLYVLNLQSGAIMKLLDPRSSSPRKAIINAQFEARVRFLTDQKRAEAAASQAALIVSSSTASVTDPIVAVAQVPAASDSVKLSANETKEIMSDILAQPYEAAISSVSYSQRLEVFSSASDGSVWINEERSSDGWGVGTSNTLMRLVPLPHETYRSTHGDAATPSALVQDERNLQAERDPLFLAAKGSQQFSPLSLKDLEAASSASSTSSDSKINFSSVPEIDAAHSHSTAQKGASVDADPPPPPPLDGALKVSSVVFSTRLNVIVTCSRILRDVPQPHGDEKHDNGDEDEDSYEDEEKKGDESWSESERGGKRASKRRAAQMKDKNGKSSNSKDSHNIVDDDSYIILVWDYLKMTLLGACARSPLDPRGGITSRVASRANAAALLAKQGAYALMSTFNSSMDSSVTDGFNDTIPTSQGGSSFDMGNLSSLLLPQTTCMSFLDPLAALITSHDDGGVRIWAMPPASLPFTMRSIFFVPNNPTLSLYSSEASKSPQRDEARAMTNAGKKLVLDVKEGSSALGEINYSNEREDRGQSTVIADGSVHFQKRRRSSIVGGIDLDDVPLLSRRRVASCITSRPALITDPMHFGSIAPVGHPSMMPFGRVFTVEGAPSVMPNLFFSKGIKPDSTEIERRRAAVLEMQLRGDGVPPVPTSNYFTKLNEQPAGEEGTVIWLGDTDGEVHRFFLSSAAIAGMGLSNVNFSDTTGEEFEFEDETHSSHDDLFERHLDETPVSSRNAAVALVWSRAQTRLWMARMAKTAAAVIKQYRGNDNADLPAETDLDDNSNLSDQSRPVIHPGLLTLFLHPGRFPLFPVIGEALPPSALKFSAPALPEPPCSFTVTHLPLPQSKRAALKVSSTKASSGPPLVTFVEPETLNPRRPLCGLIGVIWEGSWRAHVGVDIVSIQAIADSGLHAVITSGMEGLARIWDSNGRLLGTLDAQPRFCAPMPVWEKSGGGSLALLLKKQKEKYSKAQEEKKSAEAATSQFKTQAANVEDEAVAEDFDGDAGKLALSKILATIPKVYGPGIGSGYAFDRYSMSHVCSERVIDARFVHIPPNCSIAPPPEKSRPLTEEEIAHAKLPSWLAKSKAAAGAAFSAVHMEPPPPMSPAEAAMMKVLPKQWTSNPYSRPSIVPVRLTVHKLPPKDLAFDLLSTANTTPESCGVDPHAAAASRIIIGSKNYISDIHAAPRSIYLSVLSRREGLSHPSTNNEKGSRDFGLCYGSLAPPQWQVIWHVADEINLKTRRRAQADMAEIAIDLVKVFKLRALQLGSTDETNRGVESIGSFVKTVMGDEVSAKEKSQKVLRDEVHPFKKSKLGRLLTGRNESGDSLYAGSTSMARLNSHAANQASQKAKARSAILDRGDSVFLLSVNSEARIASSMATLGAIKRTSSTGGSAENSKIQMKEKTSGLSADQITLSADLPLSEKATSIMQEAHRLAVTKKDLTSPTKSVKISAEIETFHIKDSHEVSVRPPSRSQAPPSKSTVKPTRSAGEFRVRGDDPREPVEPTEFEKGMKDDPASVTLMRMDDETKRERVLGLDKPFERSLSSIGALSGPAFQNKQRQEKAREENTKRQSAKERTRLERLGFLAMDDPDIDVKAKERLLVEEAKVGSIDDIDTSLIKPEALGGPKRHVGIGESSAADAITNLLFSIAKDKAKQGKIIVQHTQEDFTDIKANQRRKARDEAEDGKLRGKNK